MECGDLSPLSSWSPDQSADKSDKSPHSKVLRERPIAKGSRKNKLAFWRERRAGRCKAPRRRRCGDIVEERQRRRYAPFAAAPRRAAATTPGKLLRFASYDSIGHGSRSKMPNYSCASPKTRRRQETR